MKFFVGFSILFYLQTQSFAFYEPIFNEFKLFYPNIEIKIDPNSNYESASADFDGKKMWIVLHQGLLDSKKLNSNSLRMILCHEAGHLLAGNPRKDPPFDWPGPINEDGRTYLSSEGQSDYFAARICFPKIAKASKVNLPQSKRLNSLCELSWGKNTDSFYLCLNSAQAAFDFLTLSFNFNISFDTPDLSITPHLIRNTYPARQCRLDTFIAGGLRDAPRPACWFKD